MLRIIISIVSNKLITWGLIPLCLFFLWIFLSVFLNPNTSFTMLSYKQSVQVSGNQNVVLLKGKKFDGEFTAKDNHLGIVTMRFIYTSDVAYDKEDVLEFKIKEKGAGKWYSVNYYKSGLIYGLNNFPFGFIPIDNSKDKNYQFEITSLHGNASNAVHINKKDFSLTASYKYSKQEIFQSKFSLLIYLAKKIMTTYLDSSSFLYSLIYLVPLQYYLLGLLVFETTSTVVKNNYKKNKEHYDFIKNNIKKLFSLKYSLEMITIVLVALDICVIPGTYAGIILIAIGFWIATIKIAHFKSSISFSASLFSILLYILFSLFGLPLIAEKAAVWVYFFLLIGILHAFIEVVLEDK
jgi:hypothetical protein